MFNLQGDSGGPLVRKEGDEYVLIGVSSFGDCKKKPPMGFTRVAHNLDWIANVTDLTLN